MTNRQMRCGSVRIWGIVRFSPILKWTGALFLQELGEDGGSLHKRPMRRRETVESQIAIIGSFDVPLRGSAKGRQNTVAWMISVPEPTSFNKFQISTVRDS